MEEMVDVFDSESGLKTGEVVSKNAAHRLGIWHNAIHIVILSSNKKKILLQKRCSLKKLFPNMWDISVGGHISSLEDSLSSAKRELSEELGLDSNKYEFNYVTRVKEEFLYEDIISREFVDLYSIISDIRLDEITLQEEEVSEARWFSKSEFISLINEEKIINHEKEYKLIIEMLGD